MSVQSDHDGPSGTEEITLEPCELPTGGRRLSFYTGHGCEALSKQVMRHFLWTEMIFHKKRKIVPFLKSPVYLPFYSAGFFPFLADIKDIQNSS